jgi:hypothetical protein
VIKAEIALLFLKKRLFRKQIVCGVIKLKAINNRAL